MRLDYKQLEFIDPKLRDILAYVEDETGFEFTVTSLYRIGDKGNHGQLPLRAVDLRCRNINYGTQIEVDVNQVWQYDPDRPNMRCCIIHDTGSGLHFHFQVHPNTRRVD